MLVGREQIDGNGPVAIFDFSPTFEAVAGAVRPAPFSPERDFFWFIGRYYRQWSRSVLFVASRIRCCYNHPDRDVFMQTIIDTKSLGLLIRQERKSQKLTQEQLAGLTGVGVRFVRELEAGKESCQVGRALQVVASLGLTVAIRSRRESAP